MQEETDRVSIALYAGIVGSVFLGYGATFLGIGLSIVAPFVLLAARRELSNPSLTRAAVLAVLVWVGLWLPAIS